ncbi:MAG: YceD family protein [Rhodoferax sp.]
MATAYPPRTLPIEAFARAHQSLQGSVSLRELARLSECAQGEIAADAVVAYQASAEVRAQRYGAPDQIWLHVSAHTELPMVCQRCLDVATVAVECAHDFRFVASEAQAEAEDEEAEEDLLVLQRDFDLLGLIEDELIMALPAVPMHGQCPTQPRLSVEDAAFASAEPVRENPFAVLGQLKGKAKP